MRWILVELDDGTQEFFSHLTDAFRYAKRQEERRRHSVEFVGDFYETHERIYSGQDLRWLLRSLDDVNQWMKSSDVN